MDNKNGYPETVCSFVVERGKIREFVRAVGDPNPLYTDPGEAAAQGYPDVIAPPTFGIAMDFWSPGGIEAETRAMGMDPHTVLHGEQEYEYYGPVFPGDRITVVSRVTADEVKPGRSGAMRLVRVERIYTNQRGEKVMVGRGVRIQRERGPSR